MNDNKTKAFVLDEMDDEKYEFVPPIPPTPKPAKETPKKDPPKHKLIKPFYNIKELAPLLGMTVKAIQNRIDRGTLDLPLRKLMGRHVVYISELKESKPDLFSSICEAAILNSIHETSATAEQLMRDLDEDDRTFNG
jgi:hypothetical protein